MGRFYAFGRVLIVSLCMLFVFPLLADKKQDVKVSSKESVDKLDVDVKLSSEQRVRLEAASELFFKRLADVRKMEDPDLRFQSQSFAFGAYEQSIDSVLTVDQKALRTQKIKEREKKSKD